MACRTLFVGFIALIGSAAVSCVSTLGDVKSPATSLHDVSMLQVGFQLSQSNSSDSSAGLTQGHYTWLDGWRARGRHHRFEKPRAIFADGCSGSTWITTFAAQLMEAHGYNVEEVGESLNPASVTRAGKVAGDGSDALREAQRMAAAENKTLILKAKPGANKLVETLQEIGAYIVVTYRANFVDKLLCAVNDCFVEPLVGHTVDENGQPSENGCFDRRSHEDDLKVKLNVTDLKINLRSGFFEHYLNAMQTAEASVQNTSLSYEDFSDFENNASDLDRGVRTWGELLAGWGVDANADIIRMKLEPLVGSRPLKSHADMIYNFREVEQAFEPYPDFAAFLRT